MKSLTILGLFVALFASPAWPQKTLPTVRIGIEAPAGTNSHYFVTKQLGLFQKHGVNIELISFPGGTVGLQALFAGDIQFATSDGVAGLSANLRGGNLYFIAGHGHIYQRAFKSFPVEQDQATLNVIRYMERNASRAPLVHRSEDWRWCSLWRRVHGIENYCRATGLSDRPVDWVEAEIEVLRKCVNSGIPYGTNLESQDSSYAWIEIDTSATRSS